jgi:hypothetical protein
VPNSHNLAQSLKNIRTDNSRKLRLFDIENIYTNIPTTELKNIIKNTLIYDHHTSKEEKQELLNMLDIILEQHYFQINKQFFKQNKGLTMEAPTSAIPAETFNQYLEDTIIYNILKKHQIIDYHRYVDDILITYNENHTNIEKTSD